MDDVLKILLVIGFLLFGFVRKAKKEAREEAPLPENWGGETYGGYIPEGPDSAMEREEQKSSETPVPPRKAAPEGLRAASTPPPAEAPAVPEAPPSADSGPLSIEEVRRGVIWSEILQRKY